MHAELNSLLIQNPANCASLLCQEGWQHWAFGLLVDVPKQRQSQSGVVSWTYQYSVNVFALLNYHAFVSCAAGPLVWPRVRSVGAGRSAGVWCAVLREGHARQPVGAAGHA